MTKSGFSEFIEYEYDSALLSEKLTEHTFGLNNVIPWEEKNFVLSGGLLYGILRDNFTTELCDIDLFFFGDVLHKHITINKLFNNLIKYSYKFMIGINNSVIYIFVQGIPRIIQLIMTNYRGGVEIVKLFDMTNVMSFYDGEKVYSSIKTIENIANNTCEIIKLNIWRVIKYILRGVNLFDILFYDNNFIISKFAFDKIIKNIRQNELYKETGNLTSYSSISLSATPTIMPLNFDNFPTKNVKLLNTFNCSHIQYKKDSFILDFDEKIDILNSFAKYVHTTPNIILRKDGMVDVKDVNNACNKFVQYGHKIDRYELYYNPDFQYMFIPCEFIKYEENETTNTVDIYISIKNVITDFLLRFNKNYILNNTKFVSNISYSQKCKNFENYTNKPNEIFTHPLINSPEFPHINDSDVDNFVDEPGLILKLKMYHKDNKIIFYNKDDKIYCLISVKLFYKFNNNVDYSELEEMKLEYVLHYIWNN